MTVPAYLVLADGLVFEGESVGAPGETVAEVVFNTSLTGYQEILTDPSYAGQIVCLTYPEIGNYGVNQDDLEGERPWASGLIVREANRRPSSWRAEEDLFDWLARHGRPAISGVDTRMLVRHLRETGAQMGVLATGEVDLEALRRRAREAPGMEGRDLTSWVSTDRVHAWEEPGPSGWTEGPPARRDGRRRIVVWDFGVKRTTLQLLTGAGCEVVVVPAGATPEEILALQPDGIFLSNGPGDPAAVPQAGDRIGRLLGRVPVFGICLGCQLLGLALGGRTYKLKYGHHGGNHPVQDLETGRVAITSENHGFALDGRSLPERVRVTHVNLNDGTVEGIAVPELDAFAVQYHPEAGPGPHDSRHLFDRFLEAVDRRRDGAD